MYKVKTNQEIYLGPAEIAQHSRALAALPEVLSSSPRTQIGWLTRPVTPALEVSTASDVQGYK